MEIDLEKYAGHTPGPWAVCNSSQLMFGRKHGNGTEPLGFVYGPSFPERSEYGQRAIADTRLIADAPELLAEVVRLRADLAEAVTALDDVTRLIIGECPALLDGDRDGDGLLSLRIDAVLAKHGGGK